MKLVNPKALVPFRGPGLCQNCGKSCMTREAAHVFSKGAGRIDHRLNLIALGGAFACGCHHRHHQGREPRTDDLLQKVSERESVPVEVIRSWVAAVRREPKHPGQETDRANDLLNEIWSRFMADHPRRKNGDGLPGGEAVRHPGDTGESVPPDQDGRDELRRGGDGVRAGVRLPQRDVSGDVQARSGAHRHGVDLTKRQRAILEFIVDCISANGMPPTIREMMGEFNITSPNGLICHFKSLAKKGYIERMGKTARGITVLRNPDGSDYANNRSQELLDHIRYWVNDLSHPTELRTQLVIQQMQEVLRAN